MIIISSFIIGLIVGSFLNVCIYRMPKSQSIVAPRSFCPSCEHTIPWYDNIPILSFLLLRGRCRFCKASISVRYLVVELLTGLAFLTLVSSFGIGPKTIIYMALTCGMIIATFVDFEYQIIPDEITYGGMILAIILSPIFPQLHGAETRLQSLLLSLAGLLTGGVVIYLTGVMGKLIFKKEAMGGGDVKFLAMIGALLGYQKVLLIFFVAPFFGSAVGIFMKLKYKAEIIPYGPYLSLATFMVIIWGEKILQYLFAYI